MAHTLPHLRVITATSLFDGHDASINMIRRILVAQGAEVIHLGHNRSVEELVQAACDEDAQAIAVSSYQGGHMEYYGFLLQQLKQRGRSDICVFGGGGGVITQAEIDQLHQQGMTRVYSPRDGQALGLEGMIADLLARTREAVRQADPAALSGAGERVRLARQLSQVEPDQPPPPTSPRRARVIGIAGTGGAGKSSVVDELLLRLAGRLQAVPPIAVVAVDPCRSKTGGALLGDRLRVNALSLYPDIFYRSLACRGSSPFPTARVGQMIRLLDQAGYSLILVETPGMGQGDSQIQQLVDYSLYVMTPEFGAASQLEKIDMLDYANQVVINKADRLGAEDALHDVIKQWQRNHQDWQSPAQTLPITLTQAARFNDAGMNRVFERLCSHLALALKDTETATVAQEGPLIPPQRQHYLGDIVECIRQYHRHTEQQANWVRQRQHLHTALELSESDPAVAAALRTRLTQLETQIDETSQQLLSQWQQLAESEEATFSTLSDTVIPRVIRPSFTDQGELLCWLARENLPGHFPYTAGVFPHRREDERVTRMFAGEGPPERTNARFHLLAEEQPAARLSTAFDSVTLYGADPSEQPDLFGKIGNAGVSVATLEDMQRLYEGFDLCDPKTSVSMTINGPAPIILAMFLNTAIDQQRQQFEARHRRPPNEEEQRQLTEHALTQVRGTVQADILKEDQGQNTCLYSINFSLRLMADMQAYFIAHRIRRFYSVSISGYHIAEAGANPISQLAFTLANGFTYVETYLAQGMAIDEFAPNLSFFFSNGMDPEYAVIGRVARRIWAIALRERYGANARSQKLKYHIQTSGRSLHAQEPQYNDIRTTLQALIAYNDHCNSLHTNAFDEALTTPTAQSVRTAMAIQLIIQQEWGPAYNENSNQGSFLIERLTTLVEEAVLEELSRLDRRGGVLPAMEFGYQRSKIQDQSMRYEQAKHDGSLPLVGINTFLFRDAAKAPPPSQLVRSTEAERQRQVSRTRAFQKRHQAQAAEALAQLKQAILRGDNSFAALMDATRICSLGQISQSLFEVGGHYRRNQ